MSKHIRVTHEEIQKALAKFRAQGGLIHLLPDTPTVRKTAVHERIGSLRDMTERGLDWNAFTVAE